MQRVSLVIVLVDADISCPFFVSNKLQNGAYVEQVWYINDLDNIFLFQISHIWLPH